MTSVVYIPGDGLARASRTRCAESSTPRVRRSSGYAASVALAPSKNGDPLPEETIAKIRQHKVAIKGPLTKPVGGRLPQL